MSTPIEHDSERGPLSRAIRASCLRGIRLGAVVGALIGVVVVLGSFVDGLRIAWRPGYTFTVPLWVLVTKLFGAVLLGVLFMATLGSGIGAVLMGISAAMRHRRKGTV